VGQQIEDRARPFAVVPVPGDERITVEFGCVNRAGSRHRLHPASVVEFGILCSPDFDHRRNVCVTTPARAHQPRPQRSGARLAGRRSFDVGTSPAAEARAVALRLQSQRSRQERCEMSRSMNLKAFRDDRSLNVIVESPRGATVKFKYDLELDRIVLSRPLPLGVVYPHDWGFVPQTRASDGDPVDAVIVWDGVSYPGVLVPCRPIGVLNVEQTSL